MRFLQQRDWGLCPLRYDSMLLANCFLMFWRNVMPMKHYPVTWHVWRMEYWISCLFVITYFDCQGNATSRQPYCRFQWTCLTQQEVTWIITQGVILYMCCVTKEEIFVTNGTVSTMYFWTTHWFFIVYPILLPDRLQSLLELPRYSLTASWASLQAWSVSWSNCCTSEYCTWLLSVSISFSRAFSCLISLVAFTCSWCTWPQSSRRWNCSQWVKYYFGYFYEFHNYTYLLHGAESFLRS